MQQQELQSQLLQLFISYCNTRSNSTRQCCCGSPAAVTTEAAIKATVAVETTAKAATALKLGAATVEAAVLKATPTVETACSRKGVVALETAETTETAALEAVTAQLLLQNHGSLRSCFFANFIYVIAFEQFRLH